MEPMCNPHTIGSSMLESLRPQLAKGSAFKNAEAPSEDTARSLAFSVSVGAFSTRSSNLILNPLNSSSQ